MTDHSFRLMGTHMRLVVDSASASAPHAAGAARALLEHYEARLSRFRPGSELCRLNADPRATVPASPLLRDAVGAALWAAERSGGLVDPTLLGELEAAGYEQSWDSARRLDLRTALSDPRERRPALPHAGERWRLIEVDRRAGTIARPPGMRIDTGGTGKGHAVDLAARLLTREDAWAVDCGGDLRIGGTAGQVREVRIEDPFGGDDPLDTILVRDGAVATSGVRSRIWSGPDGTPSHHLLDPSTGEPAFTGLVAVTALAPTALEAETLAKAALLSGPARARRILARRGGILVADDGSVQRIGRLAPPPRVRLRVPEAVAA